MRHYPREPQLIKELRPDGVNVLLMRRTTNYTVATSVGSLWPGGTFRGWKYRRPPTHFIDLPHFPEDDAKSANVLVSEDT